MKRFYLLLGVVAVLGAAFLFYAARKKPAEVPAQLSPLSLAAADGFRGFTLGSDSAPVEVTEYSDFECPFCADFAAVQMPVVREQLITTGKVRWRYRDFPLPSHAYSRYAALAAQCAGEQGKFWEMHDQIYYHQPDWSDLVGGKDAGNPVKAMRGYASGLGIDMDKYDACMQNGDYALQIRANEQEGERVGVTGTPTIIIGRRMLPGGAPPYDMIKATVDSVLAEAKLAKSGTKAGTKPTK